MKGCGCEFLKLGLDELGECGSSKNIASVYVVSWKGIAGLGE